MQKSKRAETRKRAERRDLVRKSDRTGIPVEALKKRKFSAKSKKQ